MIVAADVGRIRVKAKEQYLIKHRLPLMLMRPVSPDRYRVHPHRLSVSFLFLLPPSMLSLPWSFVAGPAARLQFQHCQMPLLLLLLLLFLLAHHRPLSLARCGAVPPGSLPACASAWCGGGIIVSISVIVVPYMYVDDVSWSRFMCCKKAPENATTTRCGRTKGPDRNDEVRTR